MAEVREIKEKISLETAKLKGKDLQEYYSSRAIIMQDKIDNSQEYANVQERSVVTSVH